MKTHEPNQRFFDELVTNGFKSISLFDNEGNRLIQFNNSKVLIKDKVKEVQQRLKIAPNGIYKLLAQFNYSNRTTPQIYYLNKGNVPEHNLSEQITITPQKLNTVSKEEKTTQNVVSLDSALTRIEELSKLRAENEVLKQRVIDLEKTVQELENELEEEPETMGEQNTDAFGSWIEKIAPSLVPLADEYFKVQNRKLRLEEFKIMNNPNRVKTSKRQRPKQQSANNVYPDINNENQLNNFFDFLETLNEPEFNAICEDTEKNYPELYELIQTEFFEEEEEEAEAQ